MAYFDNAATTFPKPECVYNSMNSFYRTCGGSAGRGKHKMAIGVGNLVQITRNQICKLLNCPGKQVIFTSSATIALNMILQGIMQMQVTNVYISPFEHNAVTRILHHYEEKGIIKVRTLSVDRHFHYDLERIRYQFDDAKPDCIIVSHVSNTIGLIAPVKEIFSLGKERGAITVVDMAQSAGLVELDCGLEIIDFAVFAGHKTLYGPTGISGFVMKREFRLPPVIFGGTGFDSANQDMPESLPEKFEMGTLNTVGIAGLNAALQWIMEVGPSSLFLEEQSHRKKLLDLLAQFPFMHIIGNDESSNYVGIVSCVMEGVSSESAGKIFDEREVSVRTGLHCAPIAHKFLGTFPSGTIRFSTGYFTSDKDFSELERALIYISDNL